MGIKNTEALQLVPITNIAELSQTQTSGVINTYQRAFGNPPYEEAFTNEEALGAMQSILDRGGDLIVGQTDNEIVALAGGYMKASDVYYIEELAVDPTKQGRGIGREALRALVGKALDRRPTALELRTTTRNDKAIRLYNSEGFVSQATTEVVPQTRQDGKLRLDERVYLVKNIKEEAVEKPDTLKRAAIVYPSGNTTAVVFDQMLGADREDLNSRVMSAWKDREGSQSEIEQCCFVTLPENEEAVARVEMFGGEFCGNATRSVIQLITEGKDYQGMIEVSGVDKPLNFNVSNGVIAVEMPLPADGNLATQVAEGTLIQLDGIAQLVVTDVTMQQNRTPRELLNDLLELNSYGLAEQPAVGVTYYDRATKNAEFGVWVKEVNTVFDETACGSGTCAVGVTLALDTKQNQKAEVIQPSGESITTEAAFDNESGKIVASTIAGKVSVLYDGELRLS
ncbi:MAG TPA: GNAT family N-acetyltransferase [Patescibacteria group bacterium]|nr:GNAT family N-acetyltransferase [Patescibacteria group bacterium]